MLTIYQQLQQSVDFVEAHLAEPVSAADAAEAAAMSVSSFHRYFPAVTGLRFADYLRRRRLSRGADALRNGTASILAVAVECGYDSNAAFTRAFKRHFGVSPRRFRSAEIPAPRTPPLDLIGEVHMGVLTRDLPSMRVVTFDGFRPDPEHTAESLMKIWMAKHPETAESCRIFGHNIDRQGNLAHDPDNEGYRVLVTIEEGTTPEDASVSTIDAGRFVVTGIEGSFTDDPTGSWITDGWRRLQEMVARNGLEMHRSCRWYEEWLEPTTPELTRMDLYLEITSGDLT